MRFRPSRTVHRFRAAALGALPSVETMSTCQRVRERQPHDFDVPVTLRKATTMSAAPNSTTNPSIGELISAFSAQTSRLVRDEMRLAQKELQQSAKHAGIGVGLLSVAGLLAVLGLATLIAAAVAALALVLPVWAAAV